MPVKRRPSKIRSDRISQQAIDAFSKALELEAAGKREEEGEYGRHETAAYRKARTDLYFAIGQTSWEESPLDVQEGDICPEWMGGARKERWLKAQKIRSELMEALQ